MNNDEITLEELTRIWKEAQALPDPRDGAPFDQEAIPRKLEATTNILIALKAFKDSGEYSNEEYHEMADPLAQEAAYFMGLLNAAGDDPRNLQ